MVSRRIILAVAPVGGWGKGKNNPIGAERVFLPLKLGLIGFVFPEPEGVVHFHNPL